MSDHDSLRLFSISTELHEETTVFIFTPWARVTNAHSILTGRGVHAWSEVSDVTHSTRLVMPR